MANSRDTFDYQSYLAALGVEGSADDLSAEQKNYLYDHAIKQAYGAALKVAKSDPTLASKEEREDFALNTTFDIFPDAHSTFGLQKPSENPDDVLNLQTLKAFIEADPVKTENLDYYMDKMANRVIGRTTKYEFPYLKGVSKANFKKLFFEKSGIDEYTTVDEILKSNAKTLTSSDAEGETVKRDSAAVHSVKQATQNWADAIGLVGDQLGSKQISNWASQAVIKTEEDIKNGNYERTYGKSARETLLEEGFGALVGKVNEMLVENWASIAPSLGLVGVARFLPKTGRLGIARRILTGLGILGSAQELGAIRGEERAKGVYDPEHPTSTLVAGLASASLDVIGNLNVVGSGVINEAKALLTRGGATARNATRAELRRISAKRAEIAAMREADRNILQRTGRAALFEGVTETAQEHVAMGSAALKGATYGAMDVVDRSIDTFLVGAASGAGIHTVSEAGDKLTSRAEEKEFNDRIIRGDDEGPLDVGPAAGFPKRTDIKGVNRDDLSPTDDGKDIIAGVSDKEVTTLPHAKRKDGMYEWDSLTNAATGQEDSVVSIGKYIAEGSSDREAYLRLLATINDPQIKKTIDAKQIEHRNENDEASVKFSSGQTLTVRGDRSGRLIERIVALHNANDNAVVFHKSTTIDASKIEDQSDEGLLSYLERELYTYKGTAPPELVTDTAPAGAVSIPVVTDVPRQGASGTRASFLELVEVEETDDDGNVTKREELQDTRNIEQTLREQGYFVISPEQVSAKTRKSRGIGSRDIYAYKDGILYHARLHESNNSSALYATVDGYDVETGAQIKLDDRVARQEIRTAYAKPDANNQEGQGTVVAKSIYIGPPAEGIRVQRHMKGSKAWWQFNDDDIRRLRLSRIIDDEGRNDVNYRSLVTDNGALLSLYVTDSGKVILRNQRGRLLTKGNLTRFMDEMTDEIDARQGIEYVVGVLQGKSRQGYETISLPVESGVSDEIIFVYPRNQKDSAKRKIYAVWRTSGKTAGDKRPLHRVIEWSAEEDSFPARLERLFNATSLDDLRSVFGTNWIDARVVTRTGSDGEVRYISAKSGNTGIYWTKDISKAKLFSNDTKLEDIGRNSEAATGELVSVHAILSQFNNDNSLVMFGEDTPFADILTKVKEYVHLLSPLGEPQGWTWTPSKKGFFSSVNESLLHSMGHSNDQATTSVSTEDAVASGQPELAVETQTQRIQDLEAAIREQMKLSKGAMSALSGVAKKVEAANQLSTPEEKAAALEEIADRMERNFYRNAVRIYAGVLGSRLDSNSELGQEVAEVMNDRNSTLEDMQNLVRKVEDLFNRSFPVTKLLPDVKNVDALVAMNARVSVLAGPLYSRNTRAARVRRAGAKGISLLKELLRARLMSDNRLANLLGSETLILVDTQEEAEELIAAAYGTAPFYSREGLIQGFVIPETGQVVLVGDGIRVGDAGAVLMHELGVHARRFGFSDEEFTGILDELKNRRNDDSEEGRQIREAIRRVQEGNRLNPNDRHFWEEVGAYVVETNAGNPTSIVGRIVSWIKKYLYKLGVIDADSLTNQDIVNFARGAVRTARRGDFDRNVSQAVSREAQVYGLARNLGVPIEELRKELDKIRERTTSEDSDILFSFAGERGAAALDKAEVATTRLDNLVVAREMEAANKSVSLIKLATGWERGKDGKWRYELDDSGITVRTNEAIHVLAQVVPVALRKIIDAPELFAAYPELRQLPFTYRADDDSRVAGTYFDQKHGIHLRDDLLKKPEKAKQVLMHEIQHAVQDIEGFANGGSVEEAPVNVNREKARENAPGPWLKLMTDKSILIGYLKTHGISVKANGDLSRKVRIDKYKASSINRLVKLINRLFAVKTPYYNEKRYERDIYRKLYNVGWDHFYDYVRRNVPAFKGMDKTEFDAQWGVVRSSKEEYEQELIAIKWYKSIAGETEARNVETRLGMTATERRESAAYQTEDIAREDQHILEKELQGFAQLFSAHQELRSQNDLMVDFVQTPSFKAWYGDWQTDSSLPPPAVQQAEDGNLVVKNSKGEFKVVDEVRPKFSMAISNKPVQYEEISVGIEQLGTSTKFIVPKDSVIPKKLRDKGAQFYDPEPASNFSARFERLSEYGFINASLNDRISGTDALYDMIMRRQLAVLPGTTSADFALGRFINDTFVIDYLSVNREHMSEYVFMHEMAENGVPFVTAFAYDEEIDLNEMNKPGLFDFNVSYIGQQYSSGLSRQHKHVYILAENNTPQADIDLYIQQLKARADFVEREVTEDDIGEQMPPVPWYSSLAELVGEQPRSLPAAKWLSRLVQWGNESKNRGESSPFNQEVYWTGVREWLEIKDPNDIVEPAELYDFLVGNNVEFKNIILGGPHSKLGRYVRQSVPLDNTDWDLRIRKHESSDYVFATVSSDLFADQPVAHALLSRLSVHPASTGTRRVILAINNDDITALLNNNDVQTRLENMLDATFKPVTNQQTAGTARKQWIKQFKNYREAITYFNDWFNQNIYNNPELVYLTSDTASYRPTHYSDYVMEGKKTDYGELLFYQNKKAPTVGYISDLVLDPRYWRKEVVDGGLLYTLSKDTMLGRDMHIDYTENDNKYVLTVEVFSDDDFYDMIDNPEWMSVTYIADTLEEALKYASDFIIDQDLNEQLVADEFRQGHFPREGEDLIAHTRFDTRETTDGKRILFIEEVQSDWANDLLFGKLRPEAPYVKYQKAWVTMVAKHAIAHAVEQGDIDGISWTSAEDQSNRWRTMGKRRLEVYQKTLPKAMQSILSDHVPSAKLENVDIQDIGVRQALMLTDEVRNSIQSKGFPLFSIQDTGRSSDETIEGQQIQGAPGIYNRKGGGFAMRYDETVPGHERESLIYGAVLMTDNARDTDLLRALQTSLEADSDLLDTTVGMLVRESQNGESFDRKGIFASMMREVIFEGEENPHFAEVRDALYDAAGLALHVAPSSLSLTDAELLSVANAIGVLENNVSETDVALPVPPPVPEPSRNELLDEAIQAGIEENDSVVPEYNADGTASVRTESGNTEYVFEDVNGKDENFRAALDSLSELTTDYDDGTLFSTNEDGTARKIPGLTTPEELEAFLQKILPPEIYEQIEIHWEETRTAKAILRNAFGLFFPYRATDKPIHIRAWDRSIPQVLATVMHECSHYGWTMWGSKALDAEIVRIYNAYTETIYAELPQYFEMLGISDPYLVPDKWKVYLVNEFFAHVNASLMDDSPHIANAFHISDEEYKAMRERLRGVMAEIERKIGDSLLVNIGDRTAIDKFAKDLIALTMGTVVGRGARLIQNTLQSPTGARAPLSKIQIITNDYGQTRRTVSQTREALQVAETREVIRKWGRFFPKGDVVAEFILNNFPMHNRLKGWGFFPSLNVEHAVLGESVGTAYASRLIGNFWNKVSETVASKQRKRFLDLLDLKSALLDAHFDPNLIGSRGNETFAQVFTRLGFAPDSAMMQKARLADTTALELSSMKYRNALDIRRAIRGQALELEKRMRIAKIGERTIGRMRKSMAQFESRFHADWDHRMYNVFNGETGVRDLQRLLSYLETDTGTGEMTVNERARDAERIIEAATQQEQAGLITYKQFLSSTRDARTVLKDKERLDALKHYFELRTSNAVKTRAGSDWRTMLLRNMRAEIKQLIMEASRSNNNNGYGEDHLNRISAVRGRTLEDTEEDNFYRTFLDPNTNFFESLLYSVDQQEKILQKLTFNQEMAEHILDTGMGVLRQSTEYDRSYSDSLSWAEDGSILRYVAVDPIFQHALDNEYEVNRNVREAAWSGAIDSMKANSTIYSLRLAVSNHIGSLGILMSSGHLFRIGMMKKAGHVSWKQFADKMLLNSKDLSEAENKFLQMMYKYHIWGATTSDTMMQIRNKGWHEKAIHAIFSYLRDLNVVSNMSQNGLENIVKNALDKMRQFYAFGDEWLKPWVFMNNYNNMLAKHKALTPGLREEQYERLAGKDAAEMTLQETTSWEYTPKLIRHMSMNSIRMITPDFLMHNFQMARITAAIYTRFFDVMEELGKVSARDDVNEPAMKEYKDALTKEAVQRGIGVGLTTATYYGLFGAAKGVIAYLPYALGTMLGAIKLDDDDDEKRKRCARSFFYPSEYHGATRITNWLNGGNNLFLPVMRDHNDPYSFFGYNYARNNVMLTHAPIMAATEDPTFEQRIIEAMKNFMDLSQGTMTQELVNNLMGKDKFGREISPAEAATAIGKRMMVPGVMTQILQATVGLPSTDTDFRKGRAIKVPQLAGITVNKYDVRDVTNHLGYFIREQGSLSKNVKKRAFVDDLSKGQPLPARDIAERIAKLREKNREDLNKAVYLLKGIRDFGLSEKEIHKYLTTSRKNAATLVGKDNAMAFLKGQNIFDIMLLNSLEEKKRNLLKSVPTSRMDKESIDIAIANTDRAIKLMRQSLRISAE